MCTVKKTELVETVEWWLPGAGAWGNWDVKV